MGSRRIKIIVILLMVAITAAAGMILHVHYRGHPAEIIDGDLILATRPEYPFSWVITCNQKGQSLVVGQRDNGHLDSWIWNPDGKKIPLIFPETFNAEPTDINDNGVVVGRGFFTDKKSDFQSFRYDDGKGFQLLPYPDETFHGNMMACEITESGLIGGDVVTINSSDQSIFILDPDQGFTLVSLGTSKTFFRDMNNRGDIVGGLRLPGEDHAFLWTRESGIVDLHFIGKGSKDTEALAINDSGWILIEAFDGMNSTQPAQFIWYDTKTNKTSSFTLNDGSGWAKPLPNTNRFIFWTEKLPMMDGPDIIGESEFRNWYCDVGETPVQINPRKLSHIQWWIAGMDAGGNIVGNMRYYGDVQNWSLERGFLLRPIRPAAPAGK